MGGNVKKEGRDPQFTFLATPLHALTSLKCAFDDDNVDGQV